MASGAAETRLASSVVVPARCRKSTARRTASGSADGKSPPAAPWQCGSTRPGSSSEPAGSVHARVAAGVGLPGELRGGPGKSDPVAVEGHRGLLDAAVVADQMAAEDQWAGSFAGSHAPIIGTAPPEQAGARNGR